MIADGDFSQHVDFMGEFAEAFKLPVTSGALPVREALLSNAQLGDELAAFELEPLDQALRALRRVWA